MARIPDSRELARPGQLYAKIKVSKSVEGISDQQLKIQKSHWFVSFCRNFSKGARATPAVMAKSTFAPEYKEAIDFLGWDLSAFEFNTAINQVFLYIMVGVFLLAAILYLTIGSIVLSLVGGLGNEITVMVYIGLACLGLGFAGITMFQKFPLSEAKAEQIRALTYVPELLGYMVMSMKLVPNLERAVEFAAEHGKGKIAEEFQSILWGLSTGKYSTLSEALDEMAERWGAYSPDFREALHKVRQSVLMDSQDKREALLDQTMADVLASVKTQMEHYARGLSQPSTMLFYIGVLLPLILIIILPVGSAFSGAPLAKLEPLILLYNIIIPTITFVFAYRLIAQRPPTYAPPKIPDSHPRLPPKNTAFVGGMRMDVRALVFIVLLVGGLTSFYVHSYGVGLPSQCIVPAKLDLGLLYEPVSGEPFSCMLQDQSEDKVLTERYKNAKYFSLDEADNGLYARLLGQGISEEKAKAQVLLEKTKFFLQPENDVSPSTFLYGVLVSLALALFVFLHFKNIYKRKIQLETMAMEREFKEAIYIIASRMAENKPIEDAMKRVKAFLPHYAISDQLFEPTSRNIEVLGLPLEDAFFDSDYGSLKDNPSTIIRSSVRLMVDSVNLGVTVAARTLISLSSQLTNSEKVNENLKVLISDVTGTMRVMALFIAPLILGITTGLQRVVMVVLAQVISNSPKDLVEQSASDLGGSFINNSLASKLSAEQFAGLVTPIEFQLIIGLYLVEIVFILIYFTTKIEEDNDTLTQMNLSRSIPIAMIVYLVALFASTALVGSFITGG